MVDVLQTSSRLKPGIRENEIVALANKRLYDGFRPVEPSTPSRASVIPTPTTSRSIIARDRPFSTLSTRKNGYALVTTARCRSGLDGAPRCVPKVGAGWTQRSICEPGRHDEHALVWPAATDFARRR